MKRILISGGHLTPALALIDYLKDNKVEELEVIFAGRIYSQDIDKQKAQEKTEVEKRQIKFVSFDAPRPATNILEKVLVGPKLAISILKAFSIMVRHRPKVFVSFGGYLAVPLGLAAWISGIPVITHEQTVSAGQANLFLAKFAKIVAVSHKESLKFFPKNKSVVTGNPIRPDLISTKPQRPEWSNDLNQEKPTLLITGGNQGSYIINTTVSQILPKIIHNWNIIHACGNPTSSINYTIELEKIKQSLPAGHRKNYIVKEWLTTSEMAWVYNIADGAVSRAGANTVQEIAFAQIPTIFIPLPFAKGNEQLLNARTLTDTGAAILLEQKNLSAETLIDKINQLKKMQKSMRRKLETHKPNTNGAAKLWNLIKPLL
ncbi:UDP-N-acetylglucosamine--N-acetylmuramyl-(pentapeptide) pyrophosphoryl-undecaprenol N-acetylglucosamine transferase [Patescibacteria group bacterium]|nr:UDP-N-acetylglucosamine--N-acetylmuramyl-(pentapeptide) pyrophosphoryl-undecaprenol N-acetylglucosamine transferase [Patescibacteria group bacterium]